jgi:hypothetical protein
MLARKWGIVNYAVWVDQWGVIAWCREEHQLVLLDFASCVSFFSGDR